MFNIKDHVMICSGKLNSFWGVIVKISKRSDGVDMYHVDTLDENNKPTVRRYVSDSLLHWHE